MKECQCGFLIEQLKAYHFTHTDPADVDLSAALHQYAKEKLTVAERLDRLRVEHGLSIK